MGNDLIIFHGRHLAGSLLTNEREILAANEKDLAAAQARGLTGPMYDRLVLTRAKLEDLAKGLNQIADSSITNVGRVVRYRAKHQILLSSQKCIINHQAHEDLKQSRGCPEDRPDRRSHGHL